jgi:hypothetical protein
MYREYLDGQFHLTYWCGECVFDMLKRLIVLFEQSNVQSQVINEQPQSQEVTLPTKKRGRPKK